MAALQTFEFTHLSGATFLGLSLLILAVSPLIAGFMLRHRHWVDALDGFVFTAVGFMIVGHILPECVESAGYGVLFLALFGLLGPLMVERTLKGAAAKAHMTALVLGLIGVFIHGIADGVILGGFGVEDAHGAAGESGLWLPLAVVIHRLPVGLMIWWLLRENFGKAVAISVLVAVGAGTIGGYYGVDHWTYTVEGSWLVYFEALVAGSLLHVVFHRHKHLDDHAGKWDLAAGFGGFLGIALLWLSAGWISQMEGHNHVSHSETMDLFLQLAATSAPALVIAYAAAGLIHVFLPHASIRWLQRGGSASQALRGVTFGLPLPMCSCGVIPFYRTLILKGVPPAAAMAFFVATPELGLDAVLLSIPLLGGEMTLARVICAFAVALFVGWFVGRLIRRSAPNEQFADELPGASTATGLGPRLREAMRVGFGDIVDNTGPWIVFGLALAALAQPAMVEASSYLNTMPDWIEVAAFALLGMPIYVCASGATPLVAVLIAGGVSPGAAIAFLLTGPATNVTTFGILSSLHGRKQALLFGATMALSSIGLGLIVNSIMGGSYGFFNAPDLHEHGLHLYEWVALALLSLIFFVSVLRQGPRRFVGQVLPDMDVDEHDHCSAEPDESESPSCCG